jgi:DNA-binding winged helix-turn-helix (wHTH) protein
VSGVIDSANFAMSELGHMNQVSATPPMRFIRFGLFEADLQAGELRKNGLKIKLQEQPFRVLSLLLERAGEIVTREELRQKLWSTDTFVDFEHSLNTSVKKLRQALGDSADNPRFVETVARRGYRFIAPVEPVGERLSNSNVAVDEVTTSSVPLVVPPEPQEVKKGSSGQRVRWGKVGTWAAVVTGLILAAAGWLYVHRLPALPLMKVVRFTSHPGTEKDPAISPDGKRLAFVWDGEGADNFDVYVRSIGPVGELPIMVEKPLRLTTDPAPDLSLVT